MSSIEPGSWRDKPSKDSPTNKSPDTTSLTSSKQTSSGLSWEQTAFLLASLHHRMELSLPAIRSDISIPKESRTSAIAHIRQEMRALTKGMEACQHMMAAALTKTEMLSPPDQAQSN